MASGTIKVNVGRSDVVNNLTTDDSTKVLSAAQGKKLYDRIVKAPVVFTSYADVKSAITSKAASMESGSLASFDFHANYSTEDELPGAYYTCVIRKYDNNSYLADIISNTGKDYKITYAGNTWRMVALSDLVDPLLSGSHDWISNADLDDYTKTGIYFFGNGTKIGGTAVSSYSWCVLVVYAGKSDTIVQTAYMSNKTDVRTRQYRSSSWSEFLSVYETSAKCADFTVAVTCSTAFGSTGLYRGTATVALPTGVTGNRIKGVIIKSSLDTTYGDTWNWSNAGTVGNSGATIVAWCSTQNRVITVDGSFVYV